VEKVTAKGNAGFMTNVTCKLSA